MTDQAYPEPRIVETSVTCPALARLPKLPVTMLVLHQERAVDDPRRALAQSLTRIAAELGAAEGVRVSEHRFSSWEALADALPRGRFDGVFVRPTATPHDAEDVHEPRADVVDTLGRLLSLSESRFCLLEPPVPALLDATSSERRERLARALAAGGGPPLVLLPAAWAPEQVEEFGRGFFERILHDSPLAHAVGVGSEGASGVPTLFVPTGRRHGLDLGRLLEDHRRRIGEAGSKVRIFQREMEAARPLGSEQTGTGRWLSIVAGVALRQAELEGIKAAVEEINRDRDPAGWSRLASSIAALIVWEAALQAERARLEEYRLFEAEHP